jgi:hypothetical protein
LQEGDDEGVRILSNLDGLDNIETPLYNPKDLDDSDKINRLVRDNFVGKIGDDFGVPESLAEYVTISRLEDMLDFGGGVFDKVVSLNTSVAGKNVSIDWGTAYNTKRLGDLIKQSEKSKVQVNEAKDSTSNKYPFYTSGLNIYGWKESFVDGKNIFCATGGNANFSYFEGPAAYSTDALVISSFNEDVLLTRYLHILLNQKQAEIGSLYFKGAGLKHLQKKLFNELQIPVPPIEVQRQIVKEYEGVEKKQAEAQAQIDSLKSDISTVMANVTGGGSVV